MLSEAELVKGCKDFSRIAQKELFVRFSGKMRGVCLRYAGGSYEAQDILQEGFIKVFSNIGKFSGSGSLEGWIRRIMVNTAISYYHKNKKLNSESIQDTAELILADPIEDEENEDDTNPLSIVHKAELSQDDLFESLKILSEAYRIVFNMYYLENYSHKEISDLLSIDEKTSRTRLFRGRQQLQKYLYEICSKKVKDYSNSNWAKK